MNSMNRRVAGIILTTVILWGCSGTRIGPSISGKIEGAAGRTVYLERYANNRGIFTDSTVIGSDGTFTIVPSHPLDKDFYRVLLDERDFLVLITDSSETVRLTATAGKLSASAKVEGSEDTRILRDFEKNYNALAKKVDEPTVRLRNELLNELEVARLRDEVMAARKALSDYVRHWLESNSSTPAAIAAVQTLDIRSDLALYQKVINDLKSNLAKSGPYKQLRQKTEFASSGGMLQSGQEINDPRSMPQQRVEGVLISIGKNAPEIALEDPAGRLRRLSDLKGKVVLLDFWASWCGPCRRENPAVVKAYDEYKKDGFEIFSVSLDKDGARWIEAIMEDGLIWENHVSDLLGWNSKPAADFGVHSIPFPVLLDREGKVIAYGPNVRGPMLEAHLKQIFGR